MEKADKTDKMDVEDKDKLMNAPGLKLGGRLYKDMIAMLQKCINDVVKAIMEKQRKRFNHNAKNFLGAHPISLTREDLHRKLYAERVDFLTCEKSDGVRYLLFITNFGDAIMNGRTEEFHLVNIPMPRSIIDEKAQQNKIQYLFDGELIVDEIGGKNYLRYLIFDCIIYNFESVFNRSYKERLEYAQTYINTLELSKKFLGKANILPQTTAETSELPEIQLYVKDFYVATAKNPALTTNPEFFIKNMAPRLPHGNDGIIFTQNEADYAVGATDTILKWKNPDQNSIDFLLVNNYSLASKFGKRIVDLYVTKQNTETGLSSFVLFDFMIVDEETFDMIGKEIGINEEMDLFLYKNASTDRIVYIAECKYDRHFTDEVLTQFIDTYSNNPKFIDELLGESVLHDDTLGGAEKNLKINLEAKKKSGKGNWKIMRKREDKTLPNALNTAEKVYASIQENITIENLRDQLFPPHGQNHVDPGPEKRVRKS